MGGDESLLPDEARVANIQSKVELYLNKVLIDDINKKEFHISIGRRALDEAKILDDPNDPVVKGLSRKHATIQKNHGASEIYIVDTSRNGTWVNGEKIEQGSKHVLSSGDKIKMPLWVKGKKEKASITITVPEQV